MEQSLERSWLRDAYFVSRARLAVGLDALWDDSGVGGTATPRLTVCPYLAVRYRSQRYLLRMGLHLGSLAVGSCRWSANSLFVVKSIRDIELMRRAHGSASGRGEGKERLDFVT